MSLAMYLEVPIRVYWHSCFFITNKSSNLWFFEFYVSFPQSTVSVSHGLSLIVTISCYAGARWSCITGWRHWMWCLFPQHMFVKSHIELHLMPTWTPRVCKSCIFFVSSSVSCIFNHSIPLLLACIFSYSFSKSLCWIHLKDSSLKKCWFPFWFAKDLLV